MTNSKAQGRQSNYQAVDGPHSRTFAHDLAALLQRLDRRRFIVEHQATLASADLRLLWLLTDGTPRTLRQIAESLELEQSTVNRQVNRAIQDGYLERFGQSDGPALVAPTARGNQRFEQDVALVLQLYNKALEAMGDKAADFLRLTELFIDAYEDAVDQTVERRS